MAGNGRLAVAIGTAAPCFVIDQASKWWVLEGLGLRSVGHIEVAPFLHFVLAWNTGVNFGLFASGAAHQQTLLAALAAAVSVGLLIWAARTDDRLVAIGCGAIVGGALGNALDRLREGAVIDFINMDCCGINNPYAFNIADAAIFAGAALIAWRAWREPTPPERTGPGDADAAADRQGDR